MAATVAAPNGEGFQTWEVTAPYIDLHADLGEGPYYEPDTHSLRFVDIMKKQLHTVSLAEGPASLRTLQLDSPVTVTADVKGADPREKIAVALKYGLALLDRATGAYEYVSRWIPEGKEGADGEKAAAAYERLRSNDGAAGPDGRFWVGVMTDFPYGAFQPEGALLRIDPGKKNAQVVRPGLTIPNSVGWSPDARTMYFTNSTARVVLAWDYDPSDGSLSNERVFYRHEGSGAPDGFRVDSEGNLWHAVYGESRVLKISPEGKLVGEVRLPTRNVTCPEFVGTELFITTAADGEALGGPESKAFGGGLFRVDVGAAGLKPFRVKLAA